MASPYTAGLHKYLPQEPEEGDLAKRLFRTDLQIPQAEPQSGVDMEDEQDPEEVVEVNEVSLSAYECCSIELGLMYVTFQIMTQMVRFAVGAPSQDIKHARFTALQDIVEELRQLLKLEGGQDDSADETTPAVDADQSAGPSTRSTTRSTTRSATEVASPSQPAAGRARRLPILPRIKDAELEKTSAQLKELAKKQKANKVLEKLREDIISIGQDCPEFETIWQAVQANDACFEALTAAPKMERLFWSLFSRTAGERLGKALAIFTHTVNPIVLSSDTVVSIDDALINTWVQLKSDEAAAGLSHLVHMKRQAEFAEAYANKQAATMSLPVEEMFDQDDDETDANEIEGLEPERNSKSQVVKETCQLLWPDDVANWRTFKPLLFNEVRQGKHLLALSHNFGPGIFAVLAYCPGWKTT